MTHMRVGGISPKLSNSTIFFCGFFLTSWGSANGYIVVGLGFGGLDFLGSMDKQNRWLIVDS